MSIKKVKMSTHPCLRISPRRVVLKLLKGFRRTQTSDKINFFETNNLLKIHVARLSLFYNVGKMVYASLKDLVVCVTVNKADIA